MKVKIIKKSTSQHMCNMRSADITAELIEQLAALGYKVVIC